MQPEWADLQTKGYVVVPSFLSSGDIDALIADFQRGAPPSSYPHGFKLVGREALDRAWPVLAPVVDRVCAETRLKVDLLPFLTFSHYIVTELTQRTSFWHQDFDFDYKLTRDHLNYLNFYLPLIKPDPSKSNVSVIPFDALAATSKDAADRLVGAGGHRFVVTNGKTAVHGNYGEVLTAADGAGLFTLDLDVDALAVTPSLAAGDLLLMRGDLIHKTQDADTRRVSASIRVTYSKKTISRERLGPCDPKAKDPLAKIVLSMHQRLDTLGRDEMTIEEFVAPIGGARGAAP